MFLVDDDITPGGGQIAFKRFYNSIDSTGPSLGTGWRHSYSRNIKSKSSGSSYRAYVSSADNSSRYSSESAACLSGFAEIKSRVSTWATATASYVNGSCDLTVGGARISQLQLLYTSPPTPAPGSTSVIAFDATRDDGEVVSFPVSGSSISAPAGITLRLTKTVSGYTVTDSNDAVETYDTSGRLQTITTRAGVVQSMVYDTAGRLSTVTDSLGHGLTLGYDAQNRLTSVTRQ